jgi:hypothetical protein
MGALFSVWFIPSVLLVDTFPGFRDNPLNVSSNRKRRIALPVMKSFLVNSKADRVKSIVCKRCPNQAQKIRGDALSCGKIWKRNLNVHHHKRSINWFHRLHNNWFRFVRTSWHNLTNYVVVRSISQIFTSVIYQKIFQAQTGKRTGTRTGTWTEPGTVTGTRKGPWQGHRQR